MEAKAVKGSRCALWGVGLMSAVALAACAGERLPAVPSALRQQAEVVGMPGVRYSTADMPRLERDLVEGVQRERDALNAAGHTGPLPPASYLALSGGGDKGAFGAGLLAGWTAAGTRPDFKVVTGVSTGALIAPFAFLGPGYDAQLREVYTGISGRDIMKKRTPLAVLFDDAMADNAPLWVLLRRLVNEEMLRAIAAEYAKGRFLLIGTTDLDAMRPILWNVGKIAASGDPRALELVHSIMIASAAIPGAFPPVLVDVEAGGTRYQEMHVDGGTSAQVFVYPAALRLREAARAAGVERERRMYIIRNARLDADWAQVERRVWSIAGRAISSLIQTQGRGDLFRIHSMALRDGVDFNLAYIPETFSALHPADFDTGYMRALFQVGYDMAAGGYPWAKAPPGY
jgi:predicted acylesterase/phospholipase RssA